MANFDEQLARMQGLMKYGVVTEAEHKANSIEHQAIGADGKSYAIIKENAKYYIKSAEPEKAEILEAYQYIDGWNHIDKHCYESYSIASKQFDMKMSSLNEAYDRNIHKENLNEFSNNQIMTEGTESMLSEIARQRQIMHNAAVIMNESAAIGMNNTGDPEGEKHSGANIDAPFTEKGKATLDKDPKKATGTPETEGDPFGKGEKPAKMNEEVDDDMFAAGLPSEEGIGSPEETKKHIMEDDEFEVMEGDDEEPEEDEDPVEDEPVEEEEPIDDLEGEIADDSEIEGEDAEEDLDNEDDLDDEDLGTEDEPMDDEEPMDELEDLKAQLEDLQNRIAELEGDEDEDFSDDEPTEDEPAEDEEPIDDDPVEDEEPIDDEEEPLTGDEEIASDDDEISDEDEEYEPEMEEVVDLTKEGDENDMFTESIISEVSSRMINESKKKNYLNMLAESVAKSIMLEEKTVLHDFGKHPGYRKKPMELPETGSDNDGQYRDWNDDSVHNEEPFGQSIGDGDPYEKAVEAITNSVMESIKKKASTK